MNNAQTIQCTNHPIQEKNPNSWLLQAFWFSATVTCKFCCPNFVGFPLFSQQILLGPHCHLIFGLHEGFPQNESCWVLFFPQFLMSISHETAWPKFWSLVAEKLLVLVLDPELFGWFFHPGLLHLGFGLHLGLLGFHVVDPHRVFQLEHNHPVVRIFQLQNIHVDILGRSNQFKTNIQTNPNNKTNSPSPQTF